MFFLYISSPMHGRRKDFFQGSSRGFSQNFVKGGVKMVKFGFYPSKLKKQPFLPIISKYVKPYQTLD